MLHIKGNRHKIEAETISTVLALYCRKKHRCKTPCIRCRIILDYALLQLCKCPYLDKKPKCSHCEMSCFKKEVRRELKIIMRWAGKRMIFYHPILTLLHYFHR